MSVMAPPRPRSTPHARSAPDVRQEPRVLINNVSWEDYVALGEILVDRPALRMTYSNETLEIMTTSIKHEAWKQYLNRLVELLLDELQMAFEPGGNMTFQREDLKRAMEPDDCYWIANERAMRARNDYDPKRDPPPDLAIEIEYSRSVLNRIEIYAALKIPEVWRYDGKQLRVLVLEDGQYVQGRTSPTFPAIAVHEIVRFMKRDAKTDSLKRKRAFLRWVRAQLSKRKRGKAK